MRFLKNRRFAPPIDWIVMGLGNPGSRYQSTRHNAGFLVLDRLAERHGASVSRLRFHALTGDARFAGARLLLMKPQTYMNLSGDAAAEALAYYKMSSDRLIVIYDDMSLPVGKLRVREKGSDGGHNGIKSIVNELSTDVFPRVKIGIGSPLFHDTKDYVLGRFDEKEKKQISLVFDAAADAVEEIIKNGTQAAAGRFNGVTIESPGK